VDDFKSVVVLRRCLRALAPRTDCRNAVDVGGGVQQDHSSNAGQRSIIANKVGTVLPLVVPRDESPFI